MSDFTINQLEKKWEQLEGALSSNKIDTHAIRHISKQQYTVDCIICSNGTRGIIINFCHVEKNLFPKKMVYEGFEIKSYKSAENSGYNLEIIVSDSKYNEVFSTFCRDLLNKIEKLEIINDIINAIINHLVLWQNFISEIRDNKLSETEIKGLFGELHFLLNILIPKIGVVNAINSWKGPQRKPQDFTFGDIGVEVKTSSDKDQVSVRITNEPQLNNTGFSHLYLYYIRVVETGDGNPTINTMIDSIYKLSFDNPDCYNKFSRDLFGCHYYGKDREYYDNTGFAVDSETPYLVTNDFPCLTRIKYLPEWISDVKYSIKLSAIEPYKVSKSDFEKSLRVVKNDN